MNHNIKTEYHIDKLSDLGYSSGDSDKIKHKKDKKNNKIYHRKIKRNINKSSSDSISENSSEFISSDNEPLFTVYGSDYSQYNNISQYNDISQYNNFSNSWHENMLKYNSQYPLIMRYLLDIDADCSESNKSNNRSGNCSGNKVTSIKPTSIKPIRPTRPTRPIKLINQTKSQIFSKIPDKQINKDLYLRDIIKTYNEMQIQYTDLFNNIRDILIRAGYTEYIDQIYIVKPIIIDHTHIPKPSDEFFSFMHKLKADINQIVQTIEKLYEYVGVKNSDVIQIREFYNNVRLKQILLVPMDKTIYPETDLNKKLADIFNLLGGRNTSNNMSGGGPLDSADQMIVQLKERLEAYKRLINPLDITSIQRLDNSKRLMLVTGEEKKYEDNKLKIPRIIEESNVSLDKFNIYDKDYLVDTILNNTDPESINNFAFNPMIETYDLTKISETLKPMYNNFSQQIKKEEIEPIIKDMEKFINYKFDDLKEDSFSFITDDEFEFKTNKETNANFETPVKKLQEEININKITINNLFLINSLPELINVIVNMDILLLEQGKDINDYKTLDSVYNDIKRISSSK
jgi:hypothetical protein